MDRNIGFLRYASSTLINHLKTCDRQTQEKRARAKHESTSPRKPSRSGAIYGSRLLSQQLTPGSGTFQLPQCPQMLPPLSAPPTRSSSPFTSLPPLPSPYANLTIPMTQSPLLSPGQSLSDQPLTPISRSQSVAIDESNEWPSDIQKIFEERIARLTVSAGLPLSWVDNPEWVDFVGCFLPSARSPSRKVLTNRLIPTAAKKYQHEIKSSVRDQNVTLQADGWTGINSHHLIAFMITFGKQVSHFPSRLRFC